MGQSLLTTEPQGGTVGTYEIMQPYIFGHACSRSPVFARRASSLSSEGVFSDPANADAHFLSAGIRQAIKPALETRDESGSWMDNGDAFTWASRRRSHLSFHAIWSSCDCLVVCSLRNPLQVHRYHHHHQLVFVPGWIQIIILWIPATRFRSSLQRAALRYTSWTLTYFLEKLTSPSKALQFNQGSSRTSRYLSTTRTHAEN